MKSIFLVVALALLSSGCAWVKLTEKGEQVVLGQEANTRGCQHLSNTNVHVADKIGPFNRSRRKVGNELVNLAKNEAARAGGDTIVSTSEAKDGRQSFKVYRCDQ